MTLQQLFKEALARAGISRNDPSAFDIACLMEETCGAGRFDLPLRGEQAVGQDQEQAFFSLLGRWLEDEPLQYLLGKWEFYGLPFYVGPGVLIPRQDTETLAEAAMCFLRGRESPVAADFCAGSGCLAAAIAHYSGTRVYALELSEAALPYLNRNIAALKVPVIVLRGDACAPPALPPLDLIVCNPPYIPRREMETLEAVVRYEPYMALYGGEDGFDFYRTLPPVCLPLLKPGGALMLETGYNQARDVGALLEGFGYQDIHIRRDAAGIERVVEGYRPV